MSGLCNNRAMSQNQVLEYQDVANALRRASTAVNAADCQGFLCGLICAGGFADQRVWVAEVFEAYDPKDLLQAEAFRLLQRLYEETLVGFNSPELDFQLLLPDDDVTLRERAESLADWCCGFLAGLGMGGLPAQDQLSDEVNEVLDDLSEISRVDFELDEPDEEDRFAFEEVSEYVRVGVMLIYEELQPGGDAQPTIQ